MMLGLEARRVVEARNRQVHLVAPLPELEAERRPAFAAIRPLGDWRAVIPVGLLLPRHVSLFDALEGYRNGAGRALAHAAMAEVSVVVVHLHGVAHAPAGASAGHLIGHDSLPWWRAPSPANGRYVQRSNARGKRPRWQVARAGARPDGGHGAPHRHGPRSL